MLHKGVISIFHRHGSDTPGKRSPDGSFLEYKFNREIARRIVLDLQDRGYDAEILVPEETDIPLKQTFVTFDASLKWYTFQLLHTKNGK